VTALKAAEAGDEMALKAFRTGISMPAGPQSPDLVDSLISMSYKRR
jgi:hypothetical protein